MHPAPSNQPHKRKSCIRYDIPGHAHALTFTCFRSQPLLSRDRSRQWLVDAIHAARHDLAFDLWGYVIMPEHVHLLIFPRADDSAISEILTAIKRPVGRAALDHVRTHAPAFLRAMRDEQPNGRIAHRFWQRGGGYDRNLCSAEIVRATLDYIHANPVRRGLVDSAEDWYWSSAGYYALGRVEPLKPDDDSIPPLDGNPDVQRGRLRT